MADLDTQLLELRRLTNQFLLMPLKLKSRAKASESLDEDLQKLREITADLSKNMESQITPKLLGTVRLILDNMESAGYIVDGDCTIVYLNKVVKARAPNLKVGEKCFRGLGYDSRENPLCRRPCRVKEALEKREATTDSLKSPISGIEYNVTTIPLSVNHKASLAMIIASRREA